MSPFSLRIFVADGDPDGLRIVEKSNWIGKTLVFPRALLPQVKARLELAQTGVYLLIGPRPDGEGDMLYVGEGDPIRPRLESHYAQKDFWTRAIGFTTTTAGQLNKAHVQFLESRLIALARAAKRVPLDNANLPAEPSLSEADRADMEVFLGHMLGMLPVLGVHAFEKAQRFAVAPAFETLASPALEPAELSTPNAPFVATPVELVCQGKGYEAHGSDTAQGFLVFAGSTATNEIGSSLSFSQRKLREDLLTNGVIKVDGAVLRFNLDYVFSSPSTAASLIHGRSANGRIEWKDSNGKTLKARQEAEAAQ
ncbi:GIY-YIG nuclease family protein [Acidovorax sp. Leaf160]|uniref:GIY-YIG nuclease family protein n=1 Tax=Acidovorax sp. Leaf160 TaxID=1736280 RepID=UPI0006FF60C3|nr:GIY-YIG nuclease family protein [Acidovorax sp. Leaf160]KQR62128.1 peptide methionine sulfoxide reductase [Acidovorax sp. Leaf160]